MNIETATEMYIEGIANTFLLYHTGMTNDEAVGIALANLRMFAISRGLTPEHLVIDSPELNAMNDKISLRVEQLVTGYMINIVDTMAMAHFMKGGHDVGWCAKLAIERSPAGAAMVSLGGEFATKYIESGMLSMPAVGTCVTAQNVMVVLRSRSIVPLPEPSVSILEKIAEFVVAKVTKGPNANREPMIRGFMIAMNAAFMLGNLKDRLGGLKDRLGANSSLECDCPDCRADREAAKQSAESASEATAVSGEDDMFYQAGEDRASFDLGAAGKAPMVGKTKKGILG